MLVVRDKQGHVFGGYASQAWTKNGKFFGEVILFLHIVLMYLIQHDACHIISTSDGHHGMTMFILPGNACGATNRNM